MNRICATIATGDLKALRTQANQAFDLGADYVEIRFDFVKPNEVEKALDEIKDVRKKAVFTLRPPSQGGNFAGSEVDRMLLLKKLAAAKPVFLDVELDTLKANDELADYLEEQKTPLLVSWHDFEKTPQSDELADILGEMRIYSNYVKIVTKAKTVEDSLRMLELYNNSTGLNLIAFAMGEAGIISRVLCTVLGNAPFTYAAIEQAVAPGQLTIKQMRSLYGSMKK